MSEFALAISTASNTYLIDAVDSFSINETSQITPHPMIGGNMVADHMIRQPCIISVSGELGMNASTKIKNLATEQKKYEDLKDNAVLCTVAKVKTKGNEFRFLKRRNMVLSGITWREGINSLGFDFTFSQVFLENSLVVRQSSETYLPSTTSPSQASFVGTLLSEDTLHQIVFETICQSGMLSDEYIEHAKSSLAVAGIAGVVAGGIVAKAVVGACISTAIAGGGTAAAFSSAASSAAVGATLSGGFILAAVVILGAICFAVYDWYQSRKALKFKCYDDLVQQAQTDKAFEDMLKEIYARVDMVNAYFTCYTLSTTGEQECTLNVNGDYYFFRFTKATLEDDALSKGFRLSSTNFVTEQNDDSVASKFLNNENNKVDIHDAIKAAESNSTLRLPTIAEDEKTIIDVTVDEFTGQYHTQYKVNTKSGMRLEVYDMNESIVSSKQIVVKASLAECTSSNYSAKIVSSRGEIAYIYFLSNQAANVNYNDLTKFSKMYDKNGDVIIRDAILNNSLILDTELEGVIMVVARIEPEKFNEVLRDSIASVLDAV